MKQKIGEDRPMTEGHLETRGHGQAVETAEQYYTDQQSAIGDQSYTCGHMVRGVHWELSRCTQA